MRLLIKLCSLFKKKQLLQCSFVPGLEEAAEVNAEENRLEGSLSMLRLVVIDKALAHALCAVQEGVSWWGNKLRWSHVLWSSGLRCEG